MQTYVLEAMKQGIETGILDPTIYKPSLAVTDSDGETQVVYSRAEILNLDNGPLKQDLVDLCMVRFGDCQIEIKAFYLFKQLYENDNSYSREMLQDHTLFEPYLPLF